MNEDNSIILTYPNLDFSYKVQKLSMNCFETFKEIEKKEYGYRLTEGQKLVGIRYRGSNYDYFVHPTIKEIRKDGLMITHLLQEKEEAPIFVPFIKNLLGVGGRYKLREMYIEPCDKLYEKNKLKDVLEGNIETNDYCLRGQIDTGEGIWYKNGGFRIQKVLGDENLKNFIKLGQLECT